jgi:hypothetical protein
MSDDVMTPPSPWTNLKFEPKIKQMNMGASADADVLKALLDGDEAMPWEPVTLPSLGLYYKDLIPGGVVEVRPMGIDTDKILATQRLAQSGKALDYLFKKCIKLPPTFDPLDLLAGDRTFLLYYLRGITHGNIYEYALECTNKECGLTATYSYDMNNLAFKIQRAREDLGPEPFKIELPYLSKVVGKAFWVKARLSRGHDVLKMTNQMGVKARMKRGAAENKDSNDPLGVDESISQNLYDVITEVMGDKSPTTIKRIIDKLHSMDNATIREYLNDVSPGIDTRIKTTCETCGNEMSMDLPITESFFRPSKSMGLAKG